MVQVTATTLLLAWTCSSAAGTGVPSIMDLQSHWVDPNVPVSAAASLGPEQRDVATINNFWVCVPFPHPPPAIATHCDFIYSILLQTLIICNAKQTLIKWH